MSSANLHPVTLIPSRITGIQFSILSPEEIRRNSVCHITSKDTYEGTRPVVNGMFDARMGVLEPGMVCPTDGKSYSTTPGYFGHIELARPVFNIAHMKSIVQICKCVCLKCSKILIDKHKHSHIVSYTSENRWTYVDHMCRNVRRCGNDNPEGCGYRQPEKIKLEGFATLLAVYTGLEKEAVTVKLSPEHVLTVFKRISDEDVAFMGYHPLFSRPEWFIYTVLPVAPPAVRPSVKLDAQQRSEDDLTHIYANILKTNTDLSNKIRDNANPHAIEGLTTMLQYFVAMMFSNKIKGADPISQRSGRPLQSISTRLNSKTGRIRGNLMGKRVDFSARSVITGDPNLSVKQLGVPMKIAKNLTKPIRVNAKNRAFLTQLVLNGPDIHPGAKILERANGESISLRHVDRQRLILNEGDVVHRHMMDGDAVLFNRQPSLHRMSMMCHIVKVMTQGDTFRFNVACTKPYNADFDGDEMNMHLAQNVLAESELRNLAAIPYQMISPAGNSPVLGIFQDSLLGSYQFTRQNYNRYLDPKTKKYNYKQGTLAFTPRHAMNLLMSFAKVDVEAFRQSIDKETGLIPSFALLTQILPPISLQFKTNLFKNDETMADSPNVLEIRNGTWIRGQIEKSVLGGGTKGILHRLTNDFGNLTATQFIDDLQNIITEYMKTCSYSVGIKDLIADDKTAQDILQILYEKKGEVQTLMDQVHLGVFKNETANSNLDELESQINNILNKASEESGKKGRESLDKSNRFVQIINCGSKGNQLNISQMVSCLGQQNIEGKRIPYGFDNRTLPHFPKYDDSPTARGFIESSYIRGLAPQELWFHAMGGRIGLIDTAVKTATTGYVQRRLIKALEDLKVEYDMTVRSSKGKIVQFAYGDDGFESMRVENQNFNLVTMSLEDIFMHYELVDMEIKEIQNVYTKETAIRLKKQKEETKILCKKYIDKMIVARDMVVDNVFHNTNETNVKVPVSFQHILANIQGQLNLVANSSVDITPLETFQLLEQYFEKIRKRFHYAPPTPLFEILYYFFLSPRQLLVVKRFHRKAIILLLETILLKYQEAIVHPGEMVGVVAGQSTGEPTTQLTLNTFHSSLGTSGRSVTRGVPRIEEILRLTENPKNPSMCVRLKPQDQTNEEHAAQLAIQLEHTKLRDVVKDIQILFDPVDSRTVVTEDRYLMERYHIFQEMMEQCSQSTPTNTDQSSPKSKWVVRMEMDSEKLLAKRITMDDIHFAIQHSFMDFGNNHIDCIYSDYNADKLVFRVRMSKHMLKYGKSGGGTDPLDQSDEIYVLKNFQESILNNIVLRGIRGIKNILPRKIQNQVVKEDGKYIRKDVWVLDSVGTNLLDCLALDTIDPKRTSSNDIREIYNVLGIEAAREAIFNELSEVFGSEVYINYHHLSLLCDRMCLTKDLVTIFRSGILNDDIGPIAKGTFEVHTEVFLKAARHAELDPMRGVSANVMCGQYGFYGTNSFRVLLDVQEMMKLEEKKNIPTRSPAAAAAATTNICQNIGIENSVEYIHARQSELCEDDGYVLF